MGVVVLNVGVDFVDGIELGLEDDFVECVLGG